MLIFWILVLFLIPALVIWSPVFAFAYWRASKASARRYAWMWAWMLPAAATAIALALTGFIGDVFGSV